MGWMGRVTEAGLGDEETILHITDEQGKVLFEIPSWDVLDFVAMTRKQQDDYIIKLKKEYTERNRV